MPDLVFTGDPGAKSCRYITPSTQPFYYRKYVYLDYERGILYSRDLHYGVPSGAVIDDATVTFSGTSDFTAVSQPVLNARLEVEGMGTLTPAAGMIVHSGTIVEGSGSLWARLNGVYHDSLSVSGTSSALFRGSKLYLARLELSGISNASFLAGFCRLAGVVFSGTSDSRFTTSLVFSGQLFLSGTGDAIFRAFIHLGGFQSSGEFYKVYVVDDLDLRYLSMHDIRLVLPQYSRYKDIEIILARDTVMLSVFRAKSFGSDPSDLLYETAIQDQGRLDLVSHRMYGIAALWWILAIVNGIRDPFTLPTSTLLRIPTHDRILREALSAESRR